MPDHTPAHAIRLALKVCEEYFKAYWKFEGIVAATRSDTAIEIQEKILATAQQAGIE